MSQRGIGHPRIKIQPKDRYRDKEDKHQRQILGRRFQHPPDAQGRKAAGEVLHHQQRHAAQRQAEAEHVGDEIAAQEILHAEDRGNHAEDDSGEADDERTALPARRIGRHREISRIEAYRMAAHCFCWPPPAGGCAGTVEMALVVPCVSYAGPMNTPGGGVLATVWPEGTSASVACWLNCSARM